MIEQIQGAQLPITQLFRLANISFDPHTFRNVCEQFATFEPNPPSDDLWRFSLNDGAKLIVALKTTPTGRKKPNGWPDYQLVSVSSAILSLCIWTTFSRSDHDSLESWQREREQFDSCYSDALAGAVEALGPPRLKGFDTDENRHHHAIWRGETGLLILQQSGYDPQFGHDVNYWIQPWSGPDPRPTSPFIDWLCNLSSSEDPGDRQ